MRLLGTVILAVQDPGLAVGSSETASSTDIVSLVVHASLVVQLVLATLLIFSAVSWGIIVFKHLQLRRAAAQTATFLQVFRKSSKFSEVQAASTTLAASPLVGLFQAGYAELNAQLRAPDAKPDTPAPRPTLKSLEAVDRALLRASTVEVTKLEYRVSFLATTASITPYIGLFGTVWGIMNAFRGLANVSQATLANVAPGIAEALIATAIGLFAAIPAVVAYNRYTHDVDRLAVRYESFIEEFSNILQRQS